MAYAGVPGLACTTMTVTSAVSEDSLRLEACDSKLWGVYRWVVRHGERSLDIRRMVDLPGTSATLVAGRPQHVTIPLTR
jgi:hypothetical protein